MLFNRTAGLVLSFILLTPLMASAQSSSTLATVTSSTTNFSPGVTGEIEHIVASHHGVMGIYCRNLATSETIAINAGVPFPTASSIKLAVMCTAFDLLENNSGPFKSYYDTQVYDAATSKGGSGFIRNYRDGTRIELKELLHFMITVSDNTGTNMLCKWIGLGPINKWLSDHGFVQTRMFSTIGGELVADEQGRDEWGLGRTTPREIGNLMAMIATGKAGTPAATDEMLRLLGHQYFDAEIPASIPPTIYVGSKSGALNHVRCDTAIVGAPHGMYVLAVYTKDNEDSSWKYSNKAEAAIREVSKVVWHHFNPDSQWTRPEGTEKF